MCPRLKQRAIQLADRHKWGSCAVPGPRPRSCSATQAGGCPPCLRPGPGTLQAPTEHPLSRRAPHTLVRTSVASLRHSVALVPCPQHLLQPAGQPLPADDKLRPGPQSCLQALTPVEQFPGGSVCLLLSFCWAPPSPGGASCGSGIPVAWGTAGSWAAGGTTPGPWDGGGSMGDRSLSPACVGRPLGCLGPRPRTDGLFLASRGNPRRKPARTSSLPPDPSMPPAALGVGAQARETRVPTEPRAGAPKS